MRSPSEHAYLLTIFLALLLALPPSANTAAPRTLDRTLAATPPPNIVVIMTDDLNLGSLADGLAHGWMPQLQSSIIDQGLTFTNSFVADSLCSPSRATFLTGQHTHNHGVLHNTYPDGGATVLEDTSTLATWLKDAGYRTGFAGKYLNGYGDDLSPSPTDDPTYVPPGWDDWQALVSMDMFNFQLNDNGTIVTEPDHQTDVLAGRAAAFIGESEANDAQPFFLWVTTFAPHGGNAVCETNHASLGEQIPAPRHAGRAGNLPLPLPPSFNEARITDKPTWIQKSYPLLTPAQIGCITAQHRGRVEAMMAVDDLIGTVVSELQADGELNDTLFVFTSDNGFTMGEHRVTKKQSAYEESIRVPLYVKVPWSSSPQTALQLVVNVDLAPTIVELAQATAGVTMDGHSLVPILQDPAFAPWRNAFLVEHTPAGAGITEYSAVRSTQYLWVEYVNGERELYDLVIDLDQIMSQHNNTAYKPAKQWLKQQLSVLKTCVGGGCWQ